MQAAANRSQRVASAVQLQRRADAGVVQRVVGDYKPGTLAVNTKAMRNLGPSEMKIVQQLHDDPTKHYTIDQARALARPTVGASNPYTWDVTGIGSNYITPDKGVQDVLESFGQPTQSVVKTYDDLANRVRFDVGSNRKGGLTSSTVNDLNQMFEASKPLHVGFNPFLNSAWSGNLAAYSGSKTGIPLYSVMRSEITKDFRDQSLGTVSLNDVLKQVSHRPSEIHHLLYKAKYPDLANTPENLMLTERSERESVYGPGQHELMHKVFSGDDKDKFNTLLPQVVVTYDDWIKAQTGKGLA